MGSVAITVDTEPTENMYEAIVEAIPLPCAVIDRQETITYLNTSFSGLFGYTHADLPTMKQWWSKLFPEAHYRRQIKDSWQQCLQAHKANLKDAAPKQVDISAKDGQKRIVLLTISPLGADFGNLYLVSLYDATERISIEQALKHAHELVHVGSWSWQPATGQNVWSAEQYRIFGVSPESFTPSYDSFMAAVHPDDCHRIEEYLKGVLGGEHQFSGMEHRIVRPDGAVRYVCSAAEVVRNSKGEILELFGTNQDITDRKLMELALQESKERLELALSGSNLALWDWHIPTGTVVYDKRWYAILGYGDQDFAPHMKTWESLTNPHDKLKLRSDLIAHLNGETPAIQNEHRLRHKDGHWIWISTRGRVMERDAESKAIRVVGTVLDITGRKRLGNEGISLLQRIESLMREAASDGDIDNPAATSSKDETFESLTRRQRQMLELIATGLTSAEIAKSLQIATATAISHRRAMMQKLNLHTAAEVTRYAIDHDLLGD